MYSSVNIGHPVPRSTLAVAASTPESARERTISTQWHIRKDNKENTKKKRQKRREKHKHTVAHKKRQKRKDKKGERNISTQWHIGRQTCMFA